MNKNRTMPVNSNRSWGDIAVDGLWPGMVGGGLMVVCLLGMELLRGVQPLTVFSYFLPDSSLPAVAGLGTHLAVSAVYGTIFGLIAAVMDRPRFKKLPLWTAGLLYGLLLGLSAQLIVIPSGLSGLDAIPTVNLLAAHMIYGASLGWLLAHGRS